MHIFLWVHSRCVPVLPPYSAQATLQGAPGFVNCLLPTVAASAPGSASRMGGVTAEQAPAGEAVAEAQALGVRAASMHIPPMPAADAGESDVAGAQG